MLSSENCLADNLSSGNTYAPYRATRLWNAVIELFRGGLPTGRHRRHMKSYEGCFVASEAVSWLHQRLQQNPNFGPQVTRMQTVQLLHKFLKAKVFEDVKGLRNEDFVDNGRLYRFVAVSPDQGSKATRVPLAMRTSLMNSDSALTTTTKPRKPALSLVRGNSVACMAPREFRNRSQTGDGGTLRRPQRPQLPQRTQSCRRERDPVPPREVALTANEMEHVWKTQTLNRIQEVLQLKNIENVLDQDSINTQHIIHNMTQINKNGLVTNVDKQDQLPHWIISAMRCLVYWPEKVEDNLPDYPGFEKDVFKVIKDYFQELPQPLITYSLYEVFLSCMAYADSIGKSQFRRKSHGRQSTKSTHTIPSTLSVENLLLNMTNQDINIGPDDILIVNDPDVTIYPGGPHGNTRTLPRSMSVASMPGARVETSFGVHNDEPETRVYNRELGDRCPSPAAHRRAYTSGAPGSRQSVKREPSLVDGFATTRGRPYSVCTSSDAAFNAYSKASELVPGQHHRSVNNVNELGLGFENPINKQSRTNSWVSVHSSLPSESGSQGSSSVYPGHGLPPVYNAQPRRHEHRESTPPPYVPPPSYRSIYCPPQQHPLGVSRRADTAHPHSVGLEPYSTPELELVPLSPLDITQSMPTLSKAAGGPRCALAESYRIAVEGGSTPAGRSLYGSQVVRRTNSSPSVIAPLSQSRVNETLQLCTLLLPPANRRKLHLLLRFMNKVGGNTQLQIEPGLSMRELVLQTFAPCVLCSEEEVDCDEVLSQQIVAFLVDGYVDILCVPSELHQQVEENLASQRRAKAATTWVDSPVVTYCEQVSVEEYERQRLSSSQQALHTLLEDIVHDRTMSQRDKRRRLKQFEKNHPDVYARKFPKSHDVTERRTEKPKIKPPLLSRPLQKLRNLRL